MSDTDSPVPAATASELWRHFVESGLLQPASYDEDVAAVLEAQLPGTGSLVARMNSAGWTARDLLRALSPVINSFAGLLRDLLAMYTDIAATHATKDNLTVSYEFDEGDTFDQSLAQFRSAITAVERSQAARGSFVLSPQRWEFPSVAKSSLENTAPWALRDKDKWDFTLPACPESDDAAVARGLSLVYVVLNAACDALRKYGETMDAVWANPAFANAPSELRQLYFDFTDYFPEAIIVQIRTDVEHLIAEPSESQGWLCQVEKWCASFWGPVAYDAQSALKSVLSLPMWGKRHDLYAAWVVCPIAAAFKTQNLQFDVVNGRLSFPFKATKIAAFKDRYGAVELWSEVRSAASGELAHGRKKGIQPDYRFLRPDHVPPKTEMAVEVKHYRQAAGSRHGLTARDYARALPCARITIVAHGPIGNTAMGRVDVVDQGRVTFRENVRSLVSAETNDFIIELTELFPSAPRVQDIEAMFCNVENVELRLIQQHPCDGETVHRGKKLEGLEASTDGELVLEIVCHPERKHTIDEAHPHVTMTFSDGEQQIFEAVKGNMSLSWHIGTIQAGLFTMSDRSVRLNPEVEI